MARWPESPKGVESDEAAVEVMVLPPRRVSFPRDAMANATSLFVGSVVEELAMMFCVWTAPEPFSI
jgi:hypothetical protein